MAKALGRRLCLALVSFPRDIAEDATAAGALPLDECAPVSGTLKPGASRMMYLQCADEEDRTEWLEVLLAQARLEVQIARAYR